MRVKCAFCKTVLWRIPSRIKRSKHHFCSFKCKGKWWTENLTGKNAFNYKNATKTGKCAICKHKITFLKIRPQTYCSYKCHGIGQRRRITLKCSGCGTSFQRPNSYVYWHKERGCKYLYCSRKCRLKYAIEEKTPNWIPDRTKLKAGINNTIRNSCRANRWKKKVLCRDNYTCQICKKRKGKNVILNVHHIKLFSKFPSKRFKVNNGITICYSCHKKIHFN